MPIRLSDALKTENNEKALEPQKQARPLVVGGQYVVHKEGYPPRPATILDTRVNKVGVREAYVSFIGQDKRLDAWVKESDVGSEVTQSEAGPSTRPATFAETSAFSSRPSDQPEAGPSTPIERSKRTERSPRSNASTPEREHAAMTRVRNFEDVRFGEYLIKTWYYSPYPLPLSHLPHSHSQTQLHGQSTPNTPQADSSASSSKRRKLHHTPSMTTKEDLTVIGIDQSHRPPLKHERTVTEMYSGVGKGGEGARGRLWACDLCFKYMRTRAGWDRHTSSCSMLQPPGRKVYQRGSYTIWEVDGANSTLYCQNLSLFGKLFIDHKSVFFHVENFLFYVLCDAATSKRDQVMAFFSKEKLSYDDYNLACIVTFPPFQNRGFGKLLIEFSYYLTKSSKSPGTPERPISDLGLKGYTAYWVSVILRFFKALLADSKPFKEVQAESPKKVIKSPVKAQHVRTPTKDEGRVLRIRKPPATSENGHSSSNKQTQHLDAEQRVKIGDAEYIKTPIPNHNKGQYAISLTLSQIAKACHLRIDDVSFTLSELGFLVNRRKYHGGRMAKKRIPQKEYVDDGDNDEDGHLEDGDGDGDGDAGNGYQRRPKDVEVEVGEEWKNTEIVITKEMVDVQWNAWRVRERGVLEDEFVLL
ncbi:uncharacterized protein I303_105576 [Kwoniella dejecticola CBS 10117]|uniref:histone acetyltransferase n=1 Tax=Kwoniella dejecticola CBS 10117 TaxID=1296121 RepID=A0A1A6A270_9TREE|nr:uncharacterized protein I303_04981 [Kwoniella dejecticola CBS 10117]OBR84124.1 hypothetical protein I303_04981 [Kwoniella dejecticola CBS 10117]